MIEVPGTSLRDGLLLVRLAGQFDTTGRIQLSEQAALTSADYENPVSLLEGTALVGYTAVALLAQTRGITTDQVFDILNAALLHAEIKKEGEESP